MQEFFFKMFFFCFWQLFFPPPPLRLIFFIFFPPTTKKKEKAQNWVLHVGLCCKRKVTPVTYACGYVRQTLPPPLALVGVNLTWCLFLNTYCKKLDVNTKTKTENDKIRTWGVLKFELGTDVWPEVLTATL